MRSISVAQAQAFDRFAQEKLGIPSLILMENAGRGVAEEAVKLVSRLVGSRVAIVCGVGNNGGDGLVAARHLLNAGVKVQVFIVGKLSKLKADPKTNYHILKKMGIAKFVRRFPKNCDLIIDALFGIGLKAEVRKPYSDIICLMNESGKPILAVDVPSGLDADTGKVLGVVVKAKRTVTFVASKKGFSKARKYCGKIIVRDIGVI
ncbi:MAG: NAD(P)H-hydrate epimerase [Candidatus Margulisiibacteriota bacterium]